MSAYDLIPKHGFDPAWAEKMLHALDAWPIVDRETAILAFARDRVVLEFGASGPMHDALATVARTLHGLDIVPAAGVTVCDLDDVSASDLPAFAGVERLVLGEVLEHLTNPGHLLRRLRAQYRVPAIISVPNAFSARGLKWVASGVECVNPEHVAYYTQHTLRELLRRTGWRVVSGGWYKGQPGLSEGLVVIAEVSDGEA